MHLSNALLPSKQNRVLAEAAGGGGRQDGDACKADDYPVHYSRRRQQRFRVLASNRARARGVGGGKRRKTDCYTSLNCLGHTFGSQIK